jgi:hypothetical protein
MSAPVPDPVNGVFGGGPSDYAPKRVRSVEQELTGSGGWTSDGLH